MLPNAKISEQAALLATIDPISQGVGTAVSGWLSAANFERFLATIDVGVFGASATVDAKLQQATSAAGAGAKDITGKAITQLLAAGGNNRQALINLRAAELDLANGFGFFQLSVTVGTAATLIAASVQGGVGKNLPASALNQAGVAQIV
jgi:hypothetical protein